MIEPRSPKYRPGQRVKAAIDLLNDGSFPGARRAVDGNDQGSHEVSWVAWVA